MHPWMKIALYRAIDNVNSVTGEGDNDPFHTWLSSVTFVPADASAPSIVASVRDTYRRSGSPSFEPGSCQALTRHTDNTSSIEAHAMVNTNMNT
mmetsp:Transcript_25081/g.37135  ORF Transcript_25081/g.37135 Transcript_25081/m.37135 type:complete len:94 (-) Transcript_25081:203-484(-)